MRMQRTSWAASTNVPVLSTLMPTLPVQLLPLPGPFCAACARGHTKECADSRERATHRTAVSRAHPLGWRSPYLPISPHISRSQSSSPSRLARAHRKNTAPDPRRTSTDSREGRDSNGSQKPALGTSRKANAMTASTRRPIPSRSEVRSTSLGIHLPLNPHLTSI